MNRRMRVFVLALGFLMLLALPSQSQSPSTELQSAIMDYRNSRFEEAIEALKGLLAQADLEEETRIEALRYVAFSHIALDDEESAEKAFAEILELQPDFQLPENTSPDVVSIFQKTVVMTVEATQGWAVVIGVADYEIPTPTSTEPFSDLRFADQDAQEFYNILTNPDRGRLDPRQVLLLINDEATRANLEDALEGWLPQNVGMEDIVIIFYSGHGWDEFLLPYDWDPGNPRQTGISVADDLPK